LTANAAGELFVVTTNSHVAQLSPTGVFQRMVALAPNAGAGSVAGFGDAHDIDFSPDGRLLAVGSRFGTVAPLTPTFDDVPHHQTVAVAVSGDRITEPSETFRVVLANPVGADVTRAQATGTITDDDPRVVERRAATSALARDQTGDGFFEYLALNPDPLTVRA